MALAPRITVEGNSSFSGVTTNVSTYSATEDATPVVLGSTSGGAGQLGFSVMSSDTVAGDPLFAWLGTPHNSASVARFATGVEICNAVKNPVLRDNATGWSASGAGVIGTRSVTAGIRGLVGFRATWSTMGAGTILVAGIPVVPGQSAIGSLYVNASAATVVTVTLTFIGANNAIVGTALVGNGIALPANTYARLDSGSGLVPSGAVTARLSASTTLSSGATLDATFAQVTPTGSVVLDIMGDLPPVAPQIATSDLVSAPVRLVDGSNGTTRVTVTGLDDTDGLTAVTADSRLAVLLATRTAKPMRDTAEAIFRYYLALGGITSEIVYQGVARPQVQAVQGWTGVVWDYLREFAIAVGAEIALVSGNVVIRPLRQRISVNRRDSSVSISRSMGDTAQSVVVKYYNNNYKTDLMYPNGGWNPDVEVYQVDAGEVFTTNIALNVSPTSIVQPQCLDYVSRNQTDSVYSVVGADGLALKAQQWLDNGGSVKVTIGEDNRSIDLTITGATTTQGPYRIAVGAGESDVYSSLRIVGTGTFFTEESVTLYTGLSPDDTPQEIGTTVENTFISTKDEAYTHGLRVAQQYAGFAQSISVTTIGINRLAASGATLFPTFAQFDSGFTASGGTAPSWLNLKFSDFDTTWVGNTFDAFNDYYIGLVEFDYGNQAFGNVTGSRVLHKDAYYRIDSATITESGVQYTGTYDTMFSDFKNRWSAAQYDVEEMNLEYGTKRSLYNDQTTYTFADFNAMMAGKTFKNFDHAPLWRLEGKYRPAISSVALYPSDTAFPSSTLFPND